MWQTILVMLILLGVSIYLLRYFVRAYRSETSPCRGCAGCCSHSLTDTRDSDCGERTSLNLTCQEVKPHDHEACS